jgi:hypothetical protein
MSLAARPRLLATVAALASAVALPSQGGTLTAARPAVTIASAPHGLEPVEGALLAYGSGWRARFDANGLTFTPASAARSPHANALRLELVAVGRRGGDAVPTVECAPIHRGDVAEYPRGACRERYEVRAAGLAQSFVFTALPHGTGDLVVTLRATTDLPLARTDAQDLTFVAAAGGGVGLHGVFGIDANGRRIAGAMHCTPRPGEAGAFTLELTLPAAFVDGAALPLVLDPLIAPIVTPGAGPEDGYPDIAYEPTTDRYLVVWDRPGTGFSSDVVGQLLDGNGAPIGPVITVRTGILGSTRKSVAAVDARDTFVVAWSEGPPLQDIVVGAVHASTGAVSAPLVVTTPGVVETAPDLGVASSQDDGPVVVWTDMAGPTVRGTRVTVGPTGVLTAGPIAAVSAAGQGRTPVVSRAPANGRLLVTWRNPADTAVHGAVVDGTLQVLAAAPLLTAPTGVVNHAVDGDGDRWLLAWEVGNQLTTGDLFARAIEWQPATSTLSVAATVPVATSSVFAEKFPGVGWLGNAAAIGYVSADFTSPTYVTTTAVATIDAIACTACEAPAIATSLPQGFGHFDTHVAVRPRPAGTASEVLLLWNEDDPVAGVTLRARAFRSDDGLEHDRGGACGGGVASHTCARPGNGGYTLRLRGAPAAQPAFVVLGTAALQVGCGPCTIGPDPATGTAVFGGTTTTNGTAALPLPLPPQPALVGFLFLQQWLTFAPTGGCVGLAASNTLEIQLQ